MNKKSTKSFFYRMLCGAFLGISVIAPGISGSIMAVMMGIYDELITIISNPFKKFKHNFFYLLPMVIGAVISILLLLKGLSFLFENYATPAYLLFISLLAGGIPSVVDEARQRPIKKRYFIGTIIAFAFALATGFLAENNFAVVSSSASLPTEIYFPICGAISGVMSMVPGMSITMLLMTLNAYHPLRETAMRLIEPKAGITSAWFGDALTVSTVAIAFVIGMILFSNVIKWIFKKYHSFSFLTVIGFMLGSIASIFITNVLPNLPHDALDWAISIIALLIGLAVSYLFRVLGKKFNVKE